MKKYLFFALNLLFSQLCLSQSQDRLQLEFRVTDIYDKSIKGAKIYIPEVGGSPLLTDNDGIAQFTSAPIGHINYEIYKDGYVSLRGSFDFSKSIHWKSEKLIPLNKEAICIWGRVKDKSKNSVKKLPISIIVGGGQKNTIYTDTTGLYYCFFNPDTIEKFRYNPNVRIIIEMKDCSKDTTITLPVNLYLQQDIYLKCTLEHDANAKYPAGTNFGKVNIKYNEAIQGMRAPFKALIKNDNSISSQNIDWVLKKRLWPFKYKIRKEKGSFAISDTIFSVPFKRSGSYSLSIIAKGNYIRDTSWLKIKVKPRQLKAYQSFMLGSGSAALVLSLTTRLISDKQYESYKKNPNLDRDLEFERANTLHHVSSASFKAGSILIGIALFDYYFFRNRKKRPLISPNFNSISNGTQAGFTIRF